MSRIVKHFIFWLVCLVLSGWLTAIPDRRFLIGILAEAWILPVKIALTYYTFYYLLPQYLDRQKVWKLVGLFLLAFLLSVVLYRLVLLWVVFPIHYPDRPRDFFNLLGILMTCFDIFTVVAAAGTFKLIRMHYANRDFEQQLRREKLQSELNFLRAQTNPHFLFNTLNNLYGLARKKSDHTADAILKLSKIMRFVLYECRSARIPIQEEVRVIQDYIELEKLRYNDRLRVHFEAILEDPEAAIAPLLLLPFVENCFKHGAANTTGDIEIDISLKLSGEQLLFEVNNSMESNTPTTEIPGGIGLKNVRRQLELIYPEKHKLIIQPSKDRFFVALSLHVEE